MCPFDAIVVSIEPHCFELVVQIVLSAFGRASMNVIGDV